MASRSSCGNATASPCVTHRRSCTTAVSTSPTKAASSTASTPRPATCSGGFPMAATRAAAQSWPMARSMSAMSIAVLPSSTSGDKKAKMLKATFFPASGGSREMSRSTAARRSRMAASISRQAKSFTASATRQQWSNRRCRNRRRSRAPLGAGYASSDRARGSRVAPRRDGQVQLRGFDAKGSLVKMIDDATWTLPQPPLPPEGEGRAAAAGRNVEGCT